MVNNETSSWLFRIKDPNGTVLVNLIKARTRSVKIGLDLAGEASFVYSMKDLFNAAVAINLSLKSLIGTGRNTLECLRNGIVFFSGQIINLNQTLNELDAEVEVKALGWFWLLGNRYVALTSDLVYSNTDAGSIAVALINAVQAVTNGNMGITIGNIQTSVSRTLTYQRKNVKEAIEELASADNGFEFEITPSKVFNVYYPRRGTDLSKSILFEYPSNYIKEIQELNDGSELRNSVLVIGSGSGIEEINAQRDDVSSQGTFGMKQKILTIKDINSAVVLGDIGDEENNRFSQINPIYRLRFNSGVMMDMLTGFNPGDTIGLQIKESYWSLNQNFRVFEIHVDIDDRDSENVELIIGLI